MYEALFERMPLPFLPLFLTPEVKLLLQGLIIYRRNADKRDRSINGLKKRDELPHPHNAGMEFRQIVRFLLD